VFPVVRFLSAFFGVVLFRQVFTVLFPLPLTIGDGKRFLMRFSLPLSLRECPYCRVFVIVCFLLRVTIAAHGRFVSAFLSVVM